MNIDAIGYRYTREELETLRLILKLPMPIGLVHFQISEEGYQKAFASLCDAGLVMDAGNQALIDPLSALLLKQACSSKHCLRMRSEARHTVLHQTPDMFLINDCTLAECTLTPIQQLHDVHDYMLAALERHSLPIIIEHISEHDFQPAEADTHESAQLILEKSLTAFLAHCY